MKQWKLFVLCAILLFCFTIMKSNSERNNEIEFYRVLIHCSGPGEPWKIEGTHAILPGLGIDNKVIIYYGKGWYRDSRVIIRNFSGEVIYQYTGAFQINMTHFTGIISPGGFLMWFLPPREIYPIPTKTIGICEKVEIVIKE